MDTEAMCTEVEDKRRERLGGKSIVGLVVLESVVAVLFFLWTVAGLYLDRWLFALWS